MKVRVCVRTCTSGAAPFAILSVFFRGAQWAYICYFDLRACLHVSDCPGADARHIIVNPLICLVYTNALIWRGVPSTVAGDHKVISVQCIRGGVVQVLVWVCVCVCLCVCNHVFSYSRYTPSEGRTGASTAPTSCGASSPRVSAAQVTKFSPASTLHVMDYT